MNELRDIRQRMDVMRRGKRTPTRVGLTRDAWIAAKSQFIAERGIRPKKTLSGKDVFGVAVTIHPGVGANFIAHRGGIEEFH